MWILKLTPVLPSPSGNRIPVAVAYRIKPLVEFVKDEAREPYRDRHGITRHFAKGPLWDYREYCPATDLIKIDRKDLPALDNCNFMTDLREVT